VSPRPTAAGTNPIGLHGSRWGSPTGGGYTSGTEEEWALAEELYRDNKIRNIALFFKDVDTRQLRDPGKQLQSVLAFKKRIEEEKRYLFKQYGAISQFPETLEEHLGRWLRDHTATDLITAGVTTSTNSTGSRTSVVAPEFDYWITEAIRLLAPEGPDHTGAMFCAVKAIGAASSDIEWARARTVEGVAQARLGRLDESIRDWCKTGGQAAIAIGGSESLAGWNLCPYSEPNVPL
jgi:hypothetical protein